MSRFLTPQELAQILAVPFPFSDRLAPLPIQDIDPDPGLFGPGSVTWRVLKEPLLILVGGRALLMQAAHPHVAQGAIDHSAYADDPFGRLMRTYEWGGTVAFGTTAEARRATAGVNRLHQKVVGTLPKAHGTRRVKGGSAYTARDEDLLLWVHATFVDTLLESHDRLVGGLTEVERDQFVREWEPVGRLLGVPDRLFWPDFRTMRAYVNQQLEHGFATPGEGSVLVSRTITHPPLPSPVLRPLFEAMVFVSLGFMPPALRKSYGVFWTPAHAAAHKSLEIFLRTARRSMPRRLRVAPIYDFAIARTRGKLAEQATRRGKTRAA